MGAAPSFSGDSSKPLWDLIGKIPGTRTHAAVYLLGCRCQELEARVIGLEGRTDRDRRPIRKPEDVAPTPDPSLPRRFRWPEAMCTGATRYRHGVYDPAAKVWCAIPCGRTTPGRPDALLDGVEWIDPAPAARDELADVVVHVEVGNETWSKPGDDGEPDGSKDRRDIIVPGDPRPCPRCIVGGMLMRCGVYECRNCGYSELAEDRGPVAAGEVSRP